MISFCRIIGKEGFSASAGIQLKGGTSDIVIERCHLTNAGGRPINLGGSTGLPYFRPVGAKHEAARLIVRNNTIEGGLCAAAFVGVDGAEFVDNTVKYPERWIFRILQETQEPGFVPCRNVSRQRKPHHLPPLRGSDRYQHRRRNSAGDIPLRKQPLGCGGQAAGIKTQASDGGEGRRLWSVEHSMEGIGRHSGYYPLLGR